jgi:uncharacterized protein (TIGR03085 family)
MSGRAARQRAAFADACADLGPSAPTLCEGWSTTDLVAHVYVREHRPDAAPGVLPLGPWSAYTERVMKSAARVHGYAELLDQVRTAPIWIRPFDDALNTVEFFVHTEDARRANGQPPRPMDRELEQFVWNRLRRQARFAFRRVQGGVRLVNDDGDAVNVGGSDVTVEARGPATELLLLSFNRKSAAQVEITGDRDALLDARIGL